MHLNRQVYICKYIFPNTKNIMMECCTCREMMLWCIGVSCTSTRKYDLFVKDYLFQ